MLIGRAAHLVARMQEVESRGADFWTFCGRDGRSAAHALFHYPAMMVPQVTGTVLDLVQEAFPTAKMILDPFVGSGTTLVEAMYRGMDFIGIDVNPLAGLLSLVKATPLANSQLKDAVYVLMTRLARDEFAECETRFPNQEKWFESSTTVHLARMARAIAQEPDIRIRRVFWVALARCVRHVCNSRLSTYKLHTVPKADIARRDHSSATAIFAQGLLDITKQMSLHNTRLASAGTLRRGSYTGSTEIIVQDSNAVLDRRDDLEFDIVITSPPYGDNATTVPYGQYLVPPHDVDTAC